MSGLRSCIQPGLRKPLSLLFRDRAALNLVFNKPALRRDLKSIEVDWQAIACVRTYPNDARISLQRIKFFARVAPIGSFTDIEVVARLAARPVQQEGTRDIDHVRRMRAFIEKRRTASRAKAAGRTRSPIDVAGDTLCSLDQAIILAPASDIRRIGCPVSAPGG